MMSSGLRPLGQLALRCVFPSFGLLGLEFGLDTPGFSVSCLTWHLLYSNDLFDRTERFHCS